MYCQLKYSEWSVYMDSIQSKMTRQACLLCFLHSTDLQKPRSKIVNVLHSFVFNNNYNETLLLLLLLFHP